MDIGEEIICELEKASAVGRTTLCFYPVLVGPPCFDDTLIVPYRLTFDKNGEPVKTPYDNEKYTREEKTQIYQTAIKNTQKYVKPQIGETIEKAMKAENIYDGHPLLDKKQFDYFYLVNKGIVGAQAVLLYPQVIEKIAEVIGESYSIMVMMDDNLIIVPRSSAKRNPLVFMNLVNERENLLQEQPTKKLTRYIFYHERRDALCPERNAE